LVQMHLNDASHHIQQQIWPARGDTQKKKLLSMPQLESSCSRFVTDVSASLVTGRINEC
jgi:hypothetical protein